MCTNGITKYDNICTNGTDEFKNERPRKFERNKYQIKGH